jgi:hypothetical protein
LSDISVTPLDHAYPFCPQSVEVDKIMPAWHLFMI